MLVNDKIVIYTVFEYKTNKLKIRLNFSLFNYCGI